MSTDSQFLGIDFGTTNSALALADRDGKVRIAHFSFQGQDTDTFRSVLFFEAKQPGMARRIPPVAGPAAIERYLEGHEGSRLIQSIKSLAASRLFTDTQISGRRYSFEDLVSLLVRGLRHDSEKQFGPLGTRLVVGRPVRFVGAETDEDEEYAISRLRTAFEREGFTDLVFEYEPVGAAYHYESTLDHDELILIADFGGGTSDFSLLRVGPAVRKRGRTAKDLLGTEGVGLAGDAFDARIIRHVVSPLLGKGTMYRSLDKELPVPDSLYLKLERWHYLSFLKSPETMQMMRSLRAQSDHPEMLDGLIQLVEGDLGFHLHRAVQKTKYELSVHEESRFYFADPAVTIEKRVRRSEFESWIAPELERIAGCVDRLLARTHVPAAEVDRVFLTGGTSLVPAVRRLFADRFGQEKLQAGDEFTSVARGLALRARDEATRPRGSAGRARTPAR